MNVRNCPDCGGIVSKSAKVCPHCGRKQDKKIGCSGNTLLLGALVIFAIFIYYIYNQKPQVQHPYPQQQQQQQQPQPLAERKEIEIEEEFDEQAAVKQYVESNELVNVTKETGHESFKIWDDYYQYQCQLWSKSKLTPDKLFPCRYLDIEYDEIWEYKRTEFLTPEEIKGAFLNKWYFYFKEKKIQGYVICQFFVYSPLEGYQENMAITNKSPQYKIINLLDRKLCLKELKEYLKDSQTQ